MPIILYTQDHKPLLLFQGAPTPLGNIALEEMQALCSARSIPLAAAALLPDGISLELGPIPPAALRELLTTFRRRTAQRADALTGSGYTAVLWQRQPVIKP